MAVSWTLSPSTLSCGCAPGNSVRINYSVSGLGDTEITGINFSTGDSYIMALNFEQNDKHSGSFDLYVSPYKSASGSWVSLQFAFTSDDEQTPEYYVSYYLRVASITMSPSEESPLEDRTIVKGNTLTISATSQTGNAPVFTSSDSSVVSVGTRGQNPITKEYYVTVTGKSVGTATITATDSGTNYSSVKKSVVLTVTPSVTYIDPPELNKSSFVYDGSEKNLNTLDAIEKLDSAHVDISGFTGTNAGDYTFSYSIKSAYSDTYEFNSGGTSGGEIHWTITKAAMPKTAPTTSSPDYNGSAQYLCTAGSCSYGTLYYGTSSALTTQPSSWSTTRPSATNCGTTYYVWYKITSTNSNYNSVEATCIGTAAIKQISQTITASNKSVTVGNTVAISASASGGGALTYSSSDTSIATVNTSGVITGVATGTCSVTINAAATTNYKAATAKTITVTVSKTTLIVSADKTSWNYDAALHVPVFTYNTTVVSKSGTTTAQINAGTYTTTFTIGSSYTNAYVFSNGSSTMSISWTISKINATVTAPTIAADRTYNGSAAAIGGAGSTTGGTLKYGYSTSTAVTPSSWSNSIPTVTDAGTYYLYYYLDGGTNYNSTSVTRVTSGHTVNKATPTFTKSDGNSTYPNGASGTVTASVAGTVYYGTSEASMTSNVGIASNTAKSIVSVAANSNYNTSSTVYAYFVPTNSNYESVGTSTSAALSVTAKVAHKAAGYINSLSTDTITGSSDNSNTITIPVQSGTLTYNGSEQSPTWTNSSSSQLTISGGTASATNAGDYSRTATLLGTAYFTQFTKTRTVGTASGTLSVSSSDTNVATVSLSSGTITITLKKAGSATITVSSTAATNYDATSKTFTVTAYNGQYAWTDGNTTAKTISWSIKQATGSATLSATSVSYTSANSSSVSVPSQSGSLTYTSNEQSPTWSYNSTYCSISGGTSAATDAGTYSRTASLNNVAYFTSGTKTVTVSSNTGTIGTPTTSDSTVATVSLSGSTVTITCKKAGSATITIPIASTTNYTAINKTVSVSSANGKYIWSDGTTANKTVTWEIKKADSSITATPTIASSVTYDKASHAIGAIGTASGGTMKYNYGTATAPLGSWSTSIPSVTDAGSYYLWYRVDGNSNYNAIAQAKLSTAFVILKRSITVPSTTGTYTYDGNDKNPSGTYSYYTVTATANKNYGTYSSTVALRYPTNTYWGSTETDTANKTVNWTIARANSSVTTAPTVNSGTTYDGSSHGLVASAGDCFGGTLHYAYGTSSAVTGSWQTDTSRVAVTSAGTYYLWYYVKGDDNHNNTSAAKVSTAFTISQKTITVKAKDQSKTYDGSVLSADTTYEVTSGSVVSGHSITITASGSVGASATSSSGVTPNVATKTLSTVTIKDSSNNNVTSNYSITKSNGSLTINKKQLTVTASSHNITYGDSVPTLSVSYSGFISGESASNLTTAPTAVTTYKQSSNVGTYATTASGAASNNYYFSYTNGSIVVSQKAMTPAAPIMAVNTEWDNASHAAHLAGKTSGGTYYYSSDNSTWGTSILTRTAIGSTTVYWKWVADSNHSGTTTGASAGTFTVSKRTISITWGTTNWNYDGSAHSTSATVGNTISGYGCTLSLANNSITDYVSGGKTVTASIATGDTYYKLPSNYTTTISINKVAGSCSAPTNKNPTYTGSDIVYANAGSCSGGSMTYCSTSSGTYTSSLPTGKDAGNYTCYWKFTPDNNHTAPSTSSGSVACTIATAEISSVAAPTANTPTYNGSAQYIVNAGTTSGGTYSYSTTGTAGSYSTTRTTQTNRTSTNTTVYWTFEANKNHHLKSGITSSGSLSSNISAKSISVAAVAKSKNYGASDPTLTFTYGGTTYNSGSQISTGVGTEKLTVTLSRSGDNNVAGTKTISGTAAAVSPANIINYSFTCITANFTINKVAGSFTSPTNKNPTYTGSPIAYANAASNIVGGTVTYCATESGTYSSSLPTGTAAKTTTDSSPYKCYWTFAPDGNHTAPSNATGSVVCSIAKAASTLPTTWTGDSRSYHSTATVTATGYAGGTIYYRTSTTSGSGYGSWTTTKPSRTDVGTTYVQCYIKGDDNHNDSSASSEVSITINQATDAQMTFTLGSGLTYNGAAQTIASVKTKDGVATYYIGLGTSPTVAPGANNWYAANTAATATAQGTYYIWYKFTPDGSHSNVKDPTYVGSVTIAKRATTTTITRSAASFTYGGTAVTYTYSDSNLISGHTATHSASNAPSSLSTAKSYTVTATTVIKDASGNDVTSNYAVTNGTTTVTVNKRSIVVTAPSDAGKTYDGSAQAYCVAGSVSNVPSGGTSGGTFTYSTTGTADSYSTTLPTRTNAGTYTLYWIFTVGLNYTINGEDASTTTKSGSVSGTIKQRSTTITVTPSTTSYKYSLTAATYTVTASNLVNSSDLGTLSAKNAPTSTSNVGTYTVSANYTANSNYNVSITTANVSVVRYNCLSVPAQSGTLTYNGDSQSPSWNSSYESGKMSLTGATSGKAATSYSAIFTPGSNYAWTDGTYAAKTVTWSIGKLAVTPIAPVVAASIEWDNTAKSVCLSGKTGGGSYSYSIDNSTWSDSVPTYTGPGSKTVYWKWTADDNHSGTTSSASAGTFTVNKRTISLTWGTTSWTYTGTAHTTTCTVGNTISGYGCTLSLANNSITNVADSGKVVTASIATGDTYYRLPSTGTTTKLYVTTVALGSIAKPSNAVYSGSAQTPTPAVTATVNGSSKTLVKDTDYTLTYSNNTNVGTATVTATGKGNYSGTVYNSWSITQATQPFAIATNSPVYGTTAMNMIKVTAAIAGGSTAYYSVGTQLTASNYSTAGSTTIPTVSTRNAGTYTVYFYTTNVTNYAAKAGSVSVTISTVALGSIAKPADATFSGLEHKPTPAVTATVNGASKTLTNGTDYTLSYANNVHHGTATVTATGKGNYSGTVSNTWTINQLALTPTAPAVKTGLTYTASSQNLISAGTTTGGTYYYGTTSANCTSTSIPTGTSAGDYTVYWKWVADNDHSGTTSPAALSTISIAKRALTVLAQNASKTYGGSDPTLTYKFGSTSYNSEAQFPTGYPNSTNSEKITIVLSRASGETATTYAITGTQSDNKTNYTVTITPATFTINRAASSVTKAPTIASNRYFDTTAKSIISAAGTCSGGTLYYAYGTSSAATGTWYTSISDVTRISAGTYYLWYYVKGDNNHNDTTAAKVSTAHTIYKTSVTVPAPSYPYDSSDKNPNTTTTYYTITGATTNKNVGTYSATASLVYPNDTYWGSTTTDNANKTISWTITKVAPSLTKAPTISTSVTYDGSAHAIATAGTCSGGTLMYTYGTSTTAQGVYSTSIPTVSDYRDNGYYLWYYIKGDDNHNNSGEAKLATAFAINKKAITVTAPTGTGFMYKDASDYLCTAGSGTGCTFTYAMVNYGETAPASYVSTRPSASQAGKYQVYWKCSLGNNYSTTSATSGNFTVEITQAVASIVLTASSMYSNPGNVVTISDYLDNTTPSVSLTYTIQSNGTTTASTLASNKLTVGNMSGSNDSDQNVVVRITNPGNTNYKPTYTDFTVIAQKKTQVAPTATGATITYDGTSSATATYTDSSVHAGTLTWTNGSSRSTYGTTTTAAYYARTTVYAQSANSNSVKLVVEQRPVSAILPVMASNKQWDNVAIDTTTLGSVSAGGTMYYYQNTTGTAPTSFSTSTWTATRPTAKDIGTYYVWAYAYVSDTTNNKQSSSSKMDINKITAVGTCSIIKRTLTINWGTTSWTYDGAQHTISPTVSNVISGYSCNVTFSNMSRTVVGSQTSTATITDDTTHYSLPSNSTATVSISARATTTTITRSAASFTYGNTPVSYEYTDSNLVQSHVAKTTHTAKNAPISTSNVGTYTVTSKTTIIDASGNDVTSNYTVTEGSTSVSVTIRTVTVTAPTVVSTTLTYNTKSQNLLNAGTVSAGGVLYYYTSTSNTRPTSFSTSTWSTTVPAQTNANTYYMWYYVYVSDTTNNVFANQNTILPGSGSLSKSIVAATVSNPNTVAETTDIVYNGSSQSPTYTASTTGMTTSGTTSAKSAGSYTITYALTSTTNYVWADGTTANKTKSWKINPKTIGLTWSTSTKVYDGTELNAGATATGLVGTDTCTVTVSPISVGPDVTTKTVTATAVNNSNYQLPTTKTASYSITKKQLTVTASSHTVTYGDATPAVSVSITGFVNGETKSVLTTQPTAETTYTATTDVKDSPVTVQAKGGAATNYSFSSSSYVDGAITIKKATVTATASSHTVTYGDAKPTLSVSYSGWRNGQNESVLTKAATATTEYTSSTSVKNSPVATTPAGAEAANYEFTPVPGAITINKRTPVLSVLGAGTYDYTGDEKVLTATIKPAIAGTLYYGADTSCGSSTSLTTTTSSASIGRITKVGSMSRYAKFTPTNTTDYNSVSVIGAYTITIEAVPATLPTTWSGASVEYEQGTATVTATGYVGGTIKYATTDSITAPVTWSSWTTTKPARTLVGTTYVKCKIFGDENHTDSVESSAVSITIYEADDASMVVDLGSGLIYNGASQTIASSAAAKRHGIDTWTLGYSTTSTTDSSTVTWMSAKTDVTRTESGTYYIWYKFTPDKSHSNVKDPTYVGSVTIAKRQVTTRITASATSFTYGSAAPTYTYTVENVASGQTYTNSASNAPVSLTDYTGSAITVTATTTIWSGNINVTSNYTIDNGTCTVTVNRCPITVTAPSDANYNYYDGSTHCYCTAGSISGVPTGGTSAGTWYYKAASSDSYTTTRPTKISAGSYTMYWKFDVSNNYYFSGEATTTRSKSSTSTGKINPKPVTITVSVNKTSMVYGDTTPTCGASCNELVHASDLGTISAMNYPTNTSSVGSYTVSASYTANSNYFVTVSKKTVTVTARPITIAADSASKQYDGTQLSKASGKLTSGSMANSDTYTITSTSQNDGLPVTVAQSPQNNIPSIVIKSSSNLDVTSNYSVTKVNGTLTITKADCQLRLSSTSATKYTGETVNLGIRNATTNPNGIITANSGAITYEFVSNTTTASTINSAGIVTVGKLSTSNDSDQTVKVKISDAGSANYNAGSLNFTITAQKYTPSITFSNATTSVTYGNTLSVAATVSASGGTCGSLTYATSGNYTALSGSTLTGNTYSNTDSDTITASVARTDTVKAASKQRYVSVTKRVVTLTWGTASWTYDGKAHSTTCTAGNLVGSDTCTVTLTNNSITNYGSVTVSASALSNTNYALPASGTTKSISIAKASLTVKGNNMSVEYNTAETTVNRDLSYKITGFVNNETEATAAGFVAPSMTTNYTVNTDAGTSGLYVRPSGCTATNYSITHSDGVLTVTKRDGSITIDDSDWNYQSSNSAVVTLPTQSNTLIYTPSTTQSPTFSYGNYSTDYVTVSAIKTTDKSSASNAGSYTMTAVLTNKAYFESYTYTRAFSNATGGVTVESTDTSVVSAAVGSAAVQATFNKAGTATIKVKVAETTNYRAKVIEISVEVKNGIYSWSDSSIGSKEVSWKIDKRTLAISGYSSISYTSADSASLLTPEQSIALKYNGKSQSPTWRNTHASINISAGTASAVTAGSYNRKATLTGAKTYFKSDSSKVFTITTDAAATVTVASNDTSVCNAVYTSSTKKITNNLLSAGAAIVTISATPTDTNNYLANSVTYAVSCANGQYLWADGTSTEKTIYWSINPVAYLYDVNAWKDVKEVYVWNGSQWVISGPTTYNNGWK